MTVRKPVVLITGANGEIGHALVANLARRNQAVISLDVNALDPPIARMVHREFTGSILDANLLERVLSEFEVDLIFHLAALLSTRSEFTPMAAHHVNVEGTLNLLEFAARETESHGRPVVFVYPSSIAAYGLPDLETRRKAGRVREGDWNMPITMYGCNKLYCEHLGRYFTRHYRQLAPSDTGRGVDFRAIRFPGLISAFTLPSGGTSDYAPEMIHAAAQGRPYACFVREDTRIPLMAMPDAIEALLGLMQAPAESLSTLVYNVSAFNPSAGELAQLVRRAFPAEQITFAADPRRQAIVDSWPEDVDDTRARCDWGFRPAYDLQRTFNEYLLPNVRRRYSGASRTP